MKKSIVSVVCASAVLGMASIAFAGAYGESESPAEIPAPPPAPAPVAAPAWQPEPAPAEMHRFQGFATDAATARGLWAEIGSMYLQESDFGLDADAVSTFARLAYGQAGWEVGAELPYGYVDVDGLGSDDGLGDLRLWGKVLPVRTDVFTLGGGLVTSFPTGSGGFTTDEYGFLPFLTAALAAGPASLRASVGYDVYTGTDVFDSVDYNVAALVPVGDRIVLRGEFVGKHFTDIGADPVSFVPGLDIRVPLGSGELLVRPTGAVGLTDEAADWGVGLSLAFEQCAS